jgi:O-antigen ligase
MAGLLPSVLGEAAHPIPALLAVALGVGITLGPATRWRRSLAVGAVLLVSAAAVGALVVKGPTLARSRAGDEPRSALWSAALEAGSARAAFGVGLGRFRTDATLFAHNEYLQVFAEAGVTGLAAIAGAIVLFGSWVWARRRDSDRVLWALAAAAAIAFLAHSAVDFLWRFPALLLLVSIWLALAGEPAARTEGVER